MMSKIARTFSLESSKVLLNQNVFRWIHLVLKFFIVGGIFLLNASNTKVEEPPETFMLGSGRGRSGNIGFQSLQSSMLLMESAFDGADLYESLNEVEEGRDDNVQDAPEYDAEANKSVGYEHMK